MPKHQKYPSLFHMLEQDKQAKQYYSKLPDYVQEHISSRGSNVNSLASLKDYAENLLRGDD